MNETDRTGVQKKAAEASFLVLTDQAAARLERTGRVGRLGGCGLCTGA